MTKFLCWLGWHDWRCHWQRHDHYYLVKCIRCGRHRHVICKRCGEEMYWEKIDAIQHKLDAHREKMYRDQPRIENTERPKRIENETIKRW